MSFGKSFISSICILNMKFPFLMVQKLISLPQTRVTVGTKTRCPNSTNKNHRFYEMSQKRPRDIIALILLQPGGGHSVYDTVSAGVHVPHAVRHGEEEDEEYDHEP